MSGELGDIQNIHFLACCTVQCRSWLKKLSTERLDHTACAPQFGIEVKRAKHRRIGSTTDTCCGVGPVGTG